MKVLQINSVCGIRSTGRIATDIHNLLKEKGYESKIAYGREESKNIDINDTIKIGNKFDFYYHAFMSRITDKAGFYSKRATKKLIKEIKEYNPDVIQLHNIHGYYINIKILFNFLKESKIPVFWTLHDCWAFTGHCAYYDYAGCEKWQKECFNCPQKKEYPQSLFKDNSGKNHRNKNEYFNCVENLNLIAISDWIGNQAKKSYLKNKNITVIHNGIDLDSFRPTKSDFRKKYNLENKRVYLGVASVWDRRKGFDTFLELSSMLNDDEMIVLVGLSEEQLNQLPGNIIGIKRTNSVKELAEIYTVADVFLNPTMEEGLGLVNIESLACGTPVITYNTGGSPECINEKCGTVVEKGDINGLLNAARNAQFSEEEILQRASRFDKKIKFEEYIKLYEGVII